MTWATTTISATATTTPTNANTRRTKERVQIERIDEEAVPYFISAHSFFANEWRALYVWRCSCPFSFLSAFVSVRLLLLLLLLGICRFCHWCSMRHFWPFILFCDLASRFYTLQCNLYVRVHKLPALVTHTHTWHTHTHTFECVYAVWIMNGKANIWVLYHLIL